MVREFAVIGHPNKGKSSIVATMAEVENIAISDLPGTTTRATSYTLRLDTEPLYTLIDTPGFQRPRAVLDWLMERDDGAHRRPQLVAEFVETFASDPRFADECELLRPLLSGAGILYVVDGTKPYGQEYEHEMEILRWTGCPRMALINLIGEGDYLGQWRDVLGQYFSIVRVFDAMHAQFEQRIEVLRAFGEVAESWKDDLEGVALALIEERDRRVDQCAGIIAGAMEEALALVVAEPERPSVAPSSGVAEDAVQNAATGAIPSQAQLLQERLRDRLRTTERHMRQSVQAVYRHSELALEAGDDIADLDLFAEASWQLFGLSRQQLVVAASVSGALAGGVLDLAVGGASFLLGAGLGAAISGASVLFGANELAKVKVLGTELGGTTVQVGPVRDPRFPWVWLGRAWLHHALCAERNHARREAIVLDTGASQDLLDGMPDALRNTLARDLQKLGRGTIGGAELAPQIGRLLRLDLSDARAD